MIFLWSISNLLGRTYGSPTLYHKGTHKAHTHKYKSLKSHYHIRHITFTHQTKWPSGTLLSLLCFLIYWEVIMSHFQSCYLVITKTAEITVHFSHIKTGQQFCYTSQQPIQWNYFLKSIMCLIYWYSFIMKSKFNLCSTLHNLNDLWSKEMQIHGVA
jgi:hypothetical protein